MTTTPLSKIIDLLPELTNGELTQLSALLSARVAAASYSMSKGPGSSKIKTGTPKPETSKKTSGKGKEKGKTPPKVSEYRDIPEYREFKASEKALHSYLKGQEGEKKMLSHWVNKQSEIQRLSGAEKEDLMASIPLVVAGFVEARNCWFRKKGNLSTEEPALGNESPKGKDSKERKVSFATEATSGTKSTT